MMAFALSIRNRRIIKRYILYRNYS